MGKIFIGKEELRGGEQADEILKKILALPSPQISKKSEDLQQNNSFIVLQREFAYQDDDGKKYFLTKDLGIYIALFAYTDDAQILIHIDHVFADLSWINKFKPFDKPMKIVLVGGIVIAKLPGVSEKILINIMQKLQEFVSTTTVEITIVAQKLLNDNLILGEDGKYNYIATLLFKAFNFCSWFFFGQSLNIQELQIKVDDLRNKESPASQLITEAIGIFDIFQNPLRIYQDYTQIKADFSIEKLQNVIITIFSKEGFLAFKQYWQQDYSNRTLGFNCQTHELVIPEELFWVAPHEMLRNMRLWDTSNMNFFLKIYDNNYIVPDLSERFITNSQNLFKHKQEDILPLFGFANNNPNSFYTYAHLAIYSAILCKYTQAVFEISLPNPSDFFKNHQQTTERIANHTVAIPIVISDNQKPEEEESSSVLSTSVCQIQ